MSDEFGDVTVPFEPTPAEVADRLPDFVCSLDEPHTGPEYHDDHGHTMCLWLGWAIKHLRESGQSDG